MRSLFLVSILLCSVIYANLGSALGGFSASHSLIYFDIALVSFWWFASFGNSRLELLKVSLSVYLIVLLLIPGSSHLASGYFPFPYGTYNDESIFGAIMVVTLFTVFIIIGYELGSKTRKKRPVSRLRQKPLTSIIHGNPDFKYFYFVQTVVIILLIIILLRYGTGTYLTSRIDIIFESRNRTSLDGAIRYQFPRVMSFASLTAILYYHKLSRNGNLLKLLLPTIPLFLIFNYPLALPRFYILSYLVCWTALFADLSSLRNKRIFALGSIVIPIFVMPFLQVITLRRQFDFSFAEYFNYYFNSLDFDGLQSTANVVSFVADNGHTLGRQILSAIFIFIPREFWEGKSLSTGSIAAEFNGYAFTRIASPLPSELYIDFGWGGLILISLILGWVFSRFDQVINLSKYEDKYYLLFGSVVFGFSFIIFRGSLIGVLAPCGLAIAVSYLLYICITNQPKRKRREKVVRRMTSS